MPGKEVTWETSWGMDCRAPPSTLPLICCPSVNRLARCGARVEEALACLRDIQMLDWQSPAGRAYRDTVGRQGAALRRAVDALEVARAAVARHAEDTMAAAASACRVP